MSDKQHSVVMTLLKIIDILIMWIAFGTATWIVHNTIGPASFEEFLSMRIKIINFILFCFITIGWYFTLSLCNFYRSKRLVPLELELLEVFKASCLGTSILLMFAWCANIQMVTIQFSIALFVVATTLILGSRVLKRLCANYLRRQGFNIKNTLIVGSNSRAIEFANKIKAAPELGYLIMGFVDNEWAGCEEINRNGYQIVADYKDFQGYIRTHIIDEVVISLPVKSLYVQSFEIMRICEEQGIMVRFLSDIFNSTKSHSMYERFEGESMILKYTGAMVGWQINVKRLFDICLSGLLLILFSPLMLISCLLIGVSSNGGIFFSQDRIGLNKRIFRLYKLRTMYADAEEKLKAMEALNEMSGPAFKIKDDPRITPIGKIMRRLSIDELPQLFNVFMGDMSLVGPRPLPIRDYRRFNEDWHRRRFSVKPGITCLWQISGRNTLTFDKWMELDMHYIDNWSLWLDLKICLRTIPAIMVGEGAM